MRDASVHYLIAVIKRLQQYSAVLNCRRKKTLT
jgi:hypothetical protein